MAPWVKCLRHKPEDLSSNPQSPSKAKGDTIGLQPWCSYSEMGGRVIMK